MPEAERTQHKKSFFWDKDLKKLKQKRVAWKTVKNQQTKIHLMTQKYTKLK